MIDFETGSGKPPGIFAVVLAAGEAKRFGATKQIAMLGGETLVHKASRLARDCCGDNTLLVTGHDAGAVAGSADWQCRYLLVNDRYCDGMGTSIAFATRSIAHVADAILLLLADQPLITPGHLRELIAAWTARDTHIVATAFEDSVGPPVLLPAGAFDALKALSGERGAKSLFGDDRFLLSTVRLEDARFDVDTQDDLARLCQRAE